MKRKPGKHFKKGEIKGRIILEILKGKNTREKLKASLTPEYISTKDVDYHLTGTDIKPGLIKKKILLERNGRLILNLHNVERLNEILINYLLNYTEFRKALDLEFAVCYFSYLGDGIMVRPELQREKCTYHNFVHWVLFGHWLSNSDFIKENIKENSENLDELKNEIISLGYKYSIKRSQNLSDEDKIAYIVAFYSHLIQPYLKFDLDTLFSSDKELIDRAFEDEDYSTDSISLAWKNMDLIKEMAKEAPGELIKKIFGRLYNIAENQYVPFWLHIEMYSFERVAGMVNSIKYDTISEINFNSEVCDQFDTLMNICSYAREMAKIILSESLIPIPELKKLGEILKQFESEQPKEARKFMNQIEKLIEKSMGKLEL